MDDSFIHPLKINLGLQVAALAALLPVNSQQSVALKQAASTQSLLNLLSDFLTLPSLTSLIAELFQPILLDLCSRWILQDSNLEGKFNAACLLVQVHTEIFPILGALLKLLPYGPLALVTLRSPLSSVDPDRLHRLLLAYYRLLQANRPLPRYLLWPLQPLSELIRAPHPNRGVQFLAIRCYSLQTGMPEVERNKLEVEAFGKVTDSNAPVLYNENLDGSRELVDGWLLPTIEATRVAEARNAIAHRRHAWSDAFTIAKSDLSVHITDIAGVLMFRPQSSRPIESSLVLTPTARRTLRELSLRMSLRAPILLTSSPSSGKSVLLMHLAGLLHHDHHRCILRIQLADTSLDPRSLLGSYVSSAKQPGSFEWKEGVLVRAMKEGKWVVFEDIDRASNEVLGVIKPLAESLGPGGWIGKNALLDLPGDGSVEAASNFMLFATRSIQPSGNGLFPKPAFFSGHKWQEVIIPSPPVDELRTIIEHHFPRLTAAVPALITLWQTIKDLGTAPSSRSVGVRELEHFCRRLDSVIPASQTVNSLGGERPEQPLTVLFPNPTLREHMYLQARDVFFGASALNATAKAHMQTVSNIIGEHLGLTPERCLWCLTRRSSEFDIEKDMDGRIKAIRSGVIRLPARATREIAPQPSRPFAMHKQATNLLSRIATAVHLNEPVLLTGETGTGKTSVITHLAALLRRPLISLNLSQQTESSDLVGGFKPVDTRVPAYALQARFITLFGQTFSKKKNAAFEDSTKSAVALAKWKRAVILWKEAARMAREKYATRKQSSTTEEVGDRDTPRKRRKVDDASSPATEEEWADFHRDVDIFDAQHVKNQGKFAFDFVEGPLVQALRNGDWILLDEVNLASSETLESITSLLHSPTASLTITERGSLEPIPRHPDFRLFTCMNPATDVGKKDLPQHIRTRFTEIDVPPPEADQEALLTIVSQYIGAAAVADKGAIMNVAEFYTAVKRLSEERTIADGSNHRPHFSMRTLSRALTFASDMTRTFPLRRAIWEGCLMAFTMVLEGTSAAAVSALAETHIFARSRQNVQATLSRQPHPPEKRSAEDFVKFGPFYLEKGPLPVDPAEDYILTPSVERKLIDLARIITTRRFPVLIEGPTSAGKTSSIEYIAKRTGHRFVRINNHEHTDIQEYLGSYVSDPDTGKLVFKDGLLVRALRAGDWIVLDELNLAPTEVLEALNRLLDDNRELVIPETQETVRPHPHFMLYATQNPPGLYAGRKILSRAFRNRFLEVHFSDVPEAELETILCQRCRIAPSYGQRIVKVFCELQKRRQSGRVFESKQGFATLRDLFRWAGREAVGYQELAEDGYMLLAERARRNDDKMVVKEVIESIMNVRIDEHIMYHLQNRPSAEASAYLGCAIPTSSGIVWTSAMRRLYVLVARALRFNEPVLLVGDTGAGKTSVCQAFAAAVGRQLCTVNCHQNTETADLVGGMRPVRNRAGLQREALETATAALQQLGCNDIPSDLTDLLRFVDQASRRSDILVAQKQALFEVRAKVVRATAIFDWHDGPLIEAMRRGDVFLLDEISLADDSVLERLNSVLEPSRTIVLAERGGDNIDNRSIVADERFKLISTMNPGGDYGKKELSPALRNRFTEIWVPAVDRREDLEQIINSLWAYSSLNVFTSKLLDFTGWLGDRVGDQSVSGMRDILAWVTFTNAACRPESDAGHCAEIFHHAARMAFLDGLGSLSQLSSWSVEAVQKLTDDASRRLRDLVPLTSEDGTYPLRDYPDNGVQFGPFALPRGPQTPSRQDFNLQASTPQSNAVRVVRACQVPKPVLLEGSPGVGKTSLVTAIANLTGNYLCRINLSDQTDLVDLFGSDLPVEGGRPGEFAWRDAEFLRALQEGHWVLLDEMNLAPQAVLEGLNSVLDHRGTVYIPELGRSFLKHPNFRIFAAQNPLHQGGGRKGLPKSFLNRFTKVYLQELTPDDLSLVCAQLFPDYPLSILQGMIRFNTCLHEEVVVKRTFGREGSPWEFNLRDILRWAILLRTDNRIQHPVECLHIAYLTRFRNSEDRARAITLFENVFSISAQHVAAVPHLSLSASYVQVGRTWSARSPMGTLAHPGSLLQSHLPFLEAAIMSTSRGWLSIITGPQGCGKKAALTALAVVTGNVLRKIPISNATDTTDILGSFEQFSPGSFVSGLACRVLDLAESVLCQASSLQHPIVDSYRELQALLATKRQKEQMEIMHTLLCDMRNLQGMNESFQEQADRLLLEAEKVSKLAEASGRFEWVDGPLVRALIEGHWLLLDGANLCSPSVLDRLNSLCENDGTLVLSERGHVNGEVLVIKPHRNFRLFMTVNPRHGELSRAMRNRGVEIALLPVNSNEDFGRLTHYCRLPTSTKRELTFSNNLAMFEACRRGMLGPFAEQAQGYAPQLNGCLTFEDSSLLMAAELTPALPQSQHEIRDRPLLHFLSQVTPISLIKPLGSALSSNRFIAPATWNRLSTIAADNFTEPLRTWRSETWGVPFTFFLSQPMDFYLKFPPHQLCDDLRDEEVQHRRLALALRMSTMLALLDDQPEIAQPPAIDINMSDRNVQTSRIRAEVHVLLMSTRDTCRALLDGLSRANAINLDILASLYILFELAQHLDKVSSSTPFNYSAVQSIIQWISNALREGPSQHKTIAASVGWLAETVVTSAGHGMTEIWESTSQYSVDYTSSTRFDEYANSLDGGLPTKKLRFQMLQVAAVRTLPSWMLTQSEHVSMAEVASLEREIEETCAKPELAQQVKCAVDVMLLFKELNALASASLKERLAIMAEVVDAAGSDGSYSISDVLPRQHLVWALESEIESLSISMTILKRWLSALWNSTGVSESQLARRDVETSAAGHGPAMLLRATQLKITISTCDPNSVRLAKFAQYTRQIERQVAFLRQPGARARRSRQLGDLLARSLISVLNCFQSSLSADDRQVVANVDSSTNLKMVLNMAGNLQHEHLRSAYSNWLQPILERLVAADGEESLGEAWIALGMLLIQLYVPDKPVDPAAGQRANIEYLKQKEDDIIAEVELHTRWEASATGNTTNIILSRLNQDLAAIRTQLQQVHRTECPVRDDVGRVHAFWKEVSRFLEQVLTLPKVAQIVNGLKANDPSSLLQEQVLQESIAGFVQRLDVGYNDFRDIHMPIQYALLHIRMGLRLTVALVQTKGAEHSLAQWLSAFPSVKGIEAISCGTSTTLHGISASQALVLKLSAATDEIATGVEVGERAQDLESTYEQVLGLWLIDCAKQDERDRDAQSLYRRQKVDYDATTEAEREEREFLELFPSYEDALQGPTAEAAQKTQLMFESSQVDQIASLHLSLFGNKSHKPSRAATYQTMRGVSLASIVKSSSQTLSDQLDVESTALQFSDLHDALFAVKNLPADYNFYHDRNIAEAEKVSTVVTAMIARIEELIQEWPEQMVLQHLLQRCQDILVLTVDSSVAKMLAALEQLLLQSEDWERYSNRHNTLKTHREAVIVLIVQWRRMELSCWKSLLQSQAEQFEAQTSEWWFKLLEGCVRAPLSTLASEEEGDALAKYLDELVPLLDGFMSSSPLGQYSRRLELLSSFASFISYLQGRKDSSQADVLNRVLLVIRSTGSFYRQFEPQISKSLSDQRSTLEKDIRNFIKLASWKDVNVQALKQSAQKTHHQLYKTIRKFRDVMRQPCTPHLVSQSLSSTDAPAQHGWEIYSSVTIQATLAQGTTALGTSRITDLAQALSQFASLLNGRLRSSLRVHSPHALDEFAADIIATSKELAMELIPADVTAEKRKQLQKNLLTRKRKAWSDLLKELKRVGFASSIKPDVIERQMSPRWLREQLGLEANDSLATQSESYTNRLSVILSDMRSVAANHNAEIQTREVQRAIAFVESGLTHALDARSRASSLFQDQRQLSNRIRRLQSMAASPSIASSGQPVLAYVEACRELTCKVVAALDEVSQGFAKAQDLGFSAPQGVKDEVASTSQRVAHHAAHLKTLRSDLRLTRDAALLQSEEAIVQAARLELQSLLDRLPHLLTQSPSFSYLLEPTAEWLQSKLAALPPTPARLIQQSSNASTDDLIHALLITVQNTLKACPPPSADPSDPSDERADHYVRTDTRAVGAVTRALGVRTIVDAIDRMLADLATSPPDAVSTHLARVLPFLGAYYGFVREHLHVQTLWTKTLFKFDYVLCATALNVARQGFCRPPDVEEDASGGGDGVEMADGVGLGAGSGAENVSKEIEDESQVEGLQGENEAEDAEREEKDGEDDAIEMSEDVGGKMQDVEKEGEDAEEDDAEEDEEEGPDEQVEKLDPSDPNAVDEKLWGDEKGPEGGDDQTTEEQQGGSNEENSDVVAKEENKKQAKEKPKDEDNAEESKEGDEQEDTKQGEGEEEDLPDTEEPSGAGAPIDEHVQEADTLDLPEDMDLGKDEAIPDDQDLNLGDDEMDEDGSMHEDQVDPSELPEGNESEDEQASGPPQHPEDTEDAMDQDDGPDAEKTAAPEGPEEGEAPEERQGDDAITAQPNVQSGDGEGQAQPQMLDHDVGASASTGQSGTVQRAEGEDGGDQEGAPEAQQQPQASSALQDANPNEGEGDASGSAQSFARQGGAPPPSSSQLTHNPLRNLGDALKELRQRFDDILESSAPPAPGGPQPNTVAPDTQLEYLQPDGEDQDMQALGPAGEEEVAKLNELKIVDEERPAGEKHAMDVDVPPPAENVQAMPPIAAPQAEPTTTAPRPDIEAALTERQVRGERPAAGLDALSNDLSHPRGSRSPSPEPTPEPTQESVEAALRAWQAAGQPPGGAEALWRLYEGLTHDLSYALCEQLRLILAPTQATRLRGDYRTGKRLNMKKIIPYVASEYTKDKIWLRRTRPSQREYQVLIALDDSRSMAESHSVHLAYETLALVSKALSRLEVGDLGIAKFGASVELVHALDASGPFSDRAGASVLSSFSFAQRATDVRALLEHSLALLGAARERRASASSSAGELWQLMLVVSDGICQDHGRLRTLLRRAEEQRVMVVFVVLDSLHAGAGTDAQAQAAGAGGAAQHSILAMTQVKYASVDGQMEMQLERYMNSFPFEYYVVLRDVEALPDVLSGTLKQFFERVSEE